MAEKRKMLVNTVHPLITWLLLGLALAGFAAAEQILTGWLPLGERANILRSNINWLEWTAIVLCVVYGVACLRTWWGLRNGEQAGISWVRWLTFLSVFIGLAFILSVIIPAYIKIFFVPTTEADGSVSLLFRVFQLGVLLALAGLLVLVLYLSVEAGLLRRQYKISARAALALVLLGVLIATPACLMWVTKPEFSGIANNIRPPSLVRLIPGLALLLLAGASYIQVRRGEEASDELRRAMALTPGKYIRVQLAASPSAGSIIGFIAIFMAFTMATDLFQRPTTYASVLTNISSQGVMAIGVTILMISGEFDLSVGSILGVVAMLFMALMTTGIVGVPVLDPLPAAILAICIGAFLGFINGFLLVTTGIPSFIVTLGTMLIYRAITLVAIQGGRILRYRDYFSEFPQTYFHPAFFIILALAGLALLAYTAYRVLPGLWKRFTSSWAMRRSNGDFGTTQALASGLFALLVTGTLLVLALWLVLVGYFHIDNGQTIQVGFFDIVNGRWAFTGSEVTRGLLDITVPSDANFRMAIIWWFIFVAFFHVILTNTAYGNAVFAVGGNVGAARAQGINVFDIKVFNYMLVAVLTGIAAIYETARNPGVDPLKGNGWELEVIAMTVIGGALLTGGYGSIIGSMLGSLIFGMLGTGLIMVGIDSRLFSGAVGVIIVVAVVLNTFVRGRRT